MTDRTETDLRHAAILAWIKAKTEELATLTPDEFEQKIAEMRAWLEEDRKKRQNG